MRLYTPDAKTKALAYLPPNFVNNRIPVMRFAIPGSRRSIVPSLRIAKIIHATPVIKKRILKLMINLEFIFKLITPKIF